MCVQCGNPFHNANGTDDFVSSGSAPITYLSPVQAGAQITRHNYHWGATLGAASGPITYGFRSSAPTYNSSSDEQGTFSQFSAQEMAAAESVVRMWANLANISFNEVNPGGFTNSATILFGNYRSTTDNVQAFTYYPSSNNQSPASSQGDVWLNINYEHTTNLFAGSYDFLTLIHEVGHALGLEHPGNYNIGPGQTFTYGNNAQHVEDSRQYTVMSYFDASNTGANHVYDGETIYASTPLLDDVAAIQRLYGANTHYATGDTTYGFHSNADIAFQITSSTQQAVFTIWDGGGNDTLDFSGYSTNQIIDLRPGTFSSIGALTLNVSIALGTIIENANGGAGNDIIYENSANNILNGGLGHDTLVLSGMHSQYQTTLNADGSVTIADMRSGSPDGTDIAIGIENFQFSDGTCSRDEFGLLLRDDAFDFEHGVLIQNRATHQLDFLNVNAATLTQSALLNTDGFWKVVAEGDLNNDGQLDLITQNNGQIDFAYLRGSVLEGSLLANGSYWDVKGTGHFSALNTGSTSSIVTQDGATGQINLLQFNGATLTASALLQGNYWNVVGVGDFNNDGRDDFVTQRDGHINFMFFNGFQLANSMEVSGTYWDVRGVEDYNHDGQPDLITQDTATGQINHLSFTGATLTASLLETTAFPGWDVVNASHAADQFWMI